jgi:hypothetical protein
MHPALRDVSDESERGKVLNHAQQASDGAVPMDDGSAAAADAPARARTLKHLVNVLGGLNLASELSLLGVNVLLSRSASRRLIAR